MKIAISLIILFVWLYCTKLLYQQKLLQMRIWLIDCQPKKILLIKLVLGQICLLLIGLFLTALCQELLSPPGWYLPVFTILAVLAFGYLLIAEFVYMDYPNYQSLPKLKRKRRRSNLMPRIQVILLGSEGKRTISEVEVYNERVVHVDDEVSLLPANFREDNGSEDCKYLNEQAFLEEKSILGSEGPFTIKEIVQWPCGRVMLYLKTPFPKSDGIGMYAENFM